MSNTKGGRSERELVTLLDEAGFAVIRAPDSGETSLPLCYPDALVPTGVVTTQEARPRENGDRCSSTDPSASGGTRSMPTENSDILEDSDDEFACDSCGETFDSKRARSIHKTKTHESVYQKEDWLRKRYCDERLTIYEVAEEADCDDETIRYWLEKNGIERRDVGGSDKDAIYKSEGWLRREYLDNRRTIRSLAEDADTDESTIRYWMDEYGISRRLRSGEDEYRIPRDADWLRGKYQSLGTTAAVAEMLGVSRSGVGKVMRDLGIETCGDAGHIDGGVTIFTNTNGHECLYFHQSGARRGMTLSLHRIVAIGEYGLDAVVGNDVHHENGVPWDNRPSNLRPLSHAEHSREHGVLLDYMEANGNGD